MALSLLRPARAGTPPALASGKYLRMDGPSGRRQGIVCRRSMQAGFDVRTARGMSALGLGAGVLLAAALMCTALLRAAFPIAPPLAIPAAPAAPVLPLGAGSLEFPLATLDHVQMQDSFEAARGGGTRTHHAVDIMAPRFTPVRAVADGTVARLASGGAGGLVVYQYDATGAWCFYYAHLQTYALGLREGQVVRRGTVIGFVGSSGNAPATAPHLHFAVYQLRERNQWWGGQAVNPYPLLKPSGSAPQQPSQG